MNAVGFGETAITVVVNGGGETGLDNIDGRDGSS